MTKSTAKSNVANVAIVAIDDNTNATTIVLKTIYNDIMNANANASLTDKKMRARLRVLRRETHVHNTSWTFTTQRDANDIRAIFDVEFATRLNAQRERENARIARANDAQRIAKRNARNARKVITTSNDMTNVEGDNVNA